MAVLKTWKAICARRGITRDKKDELFEAYLIEKYQLGATARRDYRKIVELVKVKKGL